MYVRGAKEEDLPRLYALCCLAAGRTLPEEIFEGVFRATLANPRRRVLVAFEAEEAVGYADLEVQLLLSACALVATVHEFYVREDARSKNVGSGLLIALSGQAKSIGCSEVQATCSRVNLKSQAFLERHGFVRSHHQFAKMLK